MIDIRFICNQACEILAQVVPSRCIPLDECDFPVGIDQVGLRDGLPSDKYFLYLSEE